VQEEFWHLIGVEHDAAALAAEHAHDDGPPPLVSESEFFSLHHDGHDGGSMDSDSDASDIGFDAEIVDVRSALAADIDRVRNIDARGAARNSSSSSDSDDDVACAATVSAARGSSTANTGTLRPCIPRHRNDASVGVRADSGISAEAAENSEDDFSRIALAEERVQHILNEMDEEERLG
jgi:hypothetical protein